MKVAHIIGGGDVGGAKTHVLSLLCELSKEIDIKLISLREGQFAEEGRALGLNIEVIDDKNPFAVLKKVSALCKKERFDIIHCHGAKGNVTGTLLKPFHRLPVVSTVHSDYRHDYMGKPLKNMTNGQMNRIALRFANYHIGVSDAFVEMLLERSFDPHRIFSVYNGIDFSPYDGSVAADPVKKGEYLRSLGLDWREGDVVVCIAARFNPVKSIGTLISAFCIAAAKNPRLKLLIGGNGEEEEKLRAQARESGFGDRICFAGWITDIGRFLTCSDINALTSLTESFPYAVLEGVRAGCATVCSRVGGMPKLIDHGVNGFLFDPGDDGTLAAYLQTLAESKELRCGFAEKLYEKASRLYSIEAMKNTQLSIYETILRREQKAREKRGRVLLCGSYGRGNVGDDAIMEAITVAVKSIDPDLEITVISRHPRVTRREYKTDAVHLYNIPKFCARLLRTKLYINGGGTLISDVTSTRSIRYYLYSIYLAKLFGAKTMLYGCGIGPINRPHNRRAAGRVLNRRADAITLRDEVSLRELSALGVKRPYTELTADPTLVLPPVDGDRIDSVFHEENADKDGAYAGFALRSWGDFRGRLGDVAAAAAYVYHTHGLTPLLIPMQYPHDLSILGELSSMLTVPHAVLSGKHVAREVMGVASRVRLMVGMRLHSLIFAAASGVPCVAIPYDTKVSSFMEYMGAPCRPMEEITAQTLCDDIDEALRRGPLSSEALKKRCETNVKIARGFLEG